jgi:hypothetical protein
MNEIGEVTLTKNAESNKTSKLKQITLRLDTDLYKDLIEFQRNHHILKHVALNQIILELIKHFLYQLNEESYKTNKMTPNYKGDKSSLIETMFINKESE